MPDTRTTMKVRVTVMPKASVLDPQGVAIRNTLHHLGLPAAASVRAGKVLEIEIDEPAGDRAALETQINNVARDFLSNPVIEDFHVEYPA